MMTRWSQFQVNQDSGSINHIASANVSHCLLCIDAIERVISRMFCRGLVYTFTSYRGGENVFLVRPIGIVLL